jgi:Domain of unknown function (DUF5069)
MTNAAPPRAGSVMIGRTEWLARMIDKARLDAAGTIDELDLEFPCPMDQRLLAKLKIDAKTFQSIVTTHESDDAIVEAMEAAGAQF